MKRQDIFYLLGLSFIFILSGCVVRTYSVTKDRQDQDLTVGNLGYIEGQVPEGEIGERKLTRTTKVIEVELYSPVKFEKPQPEPTEKSEGEVALVGQGAITESYVPKSIETPIPARTPASAPAVKFEKYTVQKEDNLQKVSLKFYGTTKKWTKIYEANKDVLKAPDKIYPGQVINIPIESLKETKENLK